MRGLTTKNMCGISGYFQKSPRPDHPLGATMLRMLQALGRRGPDSAGVALVGPVQPTAYIVRVQAGDELEMPPHAIAANREAIQNFAKSLEGVSGISLSGVYVRFLLAGERNLHDLATAMEAINEGIEVISIGHAMELAKEVGSPQPARGQASHLAICGHSWHRAHPVVH